MHTASELVFRAGRRHLRQVLLLIGSSIALALAFAGVAWVVDLLKPAPEVVIMAPFRW